LVFDGPLPAKPILITMILEEQFSIGAAEMKNMVLKAFFCHDGLH
jgi:hypothetical protein